MSTAIGHLRRVLLLAGGAALGSKLFLLFLLLLKLVEEPIDWLAGIEAVANIVYIYKYKSRRTS